MSRFTIVRGVPPPLLQRSGKEEPRKERNAPDEEPHTHDNRWPRLPILIIALLLSAMIWWVLFRLLGVL